MNRRQNKLKVSIGIPAFNEEQNILYLLGSLLSQKQISYTMSEIIVVTDGSEDNTVRCVKQIKNPLVKLIVGKKRQGQQVRQNQILKHFKGDILVLLEADILPANDSTIEELIKPFYFQPRPNLGMVVGVSLAIPPTNFLEKILCQGYHLKARVFSNWKSGKNIYTCGGHSMKALSKEFAEKLSWPKDGPEDAYTYFKLRELGFEMVRNPNAKSYMRNTTNLNDRLRQVTKFINGKRRLYEYFPKETIDCEYKIPPTLIIKHAFQETIRSPFWISLYFLEFILNRILTMKSVDFNRFYKPYQSSKDLTAAILMRIRKVGTSVF